MSPHTNFFYESCFVLEISSYGCTLEAGIGETLLVLAFSLHFDDEIILTFN